jgi:hypothetical protein
MGLAEGRSQLSERGARMKRKHLIVAAIALLVSLALSLGLGTRASAKDSNHKPALHDADCAHVSTAVDVVGFAVLEMDGSGNLQIEVSVKHGMPRTEYKVYVLAAPCNVIFTDDILTTNKKGKGNTHVMVPTASIPANTKISVQLVSPPTAMVPGPGPFTDIITSDFVTPLQGSDQAEDSF